MNQTFAATVAIFLSAVPAMQSAAFGQTRLWEQRVALTAPPARYSSPVAYDSFRDRFVIFGGRVGGQDLGDTWEYDGFNWIRMFPATSPSPRHGHALIWDPVSGRTLLFGGLVGRNVEANDTWFWDGVTWRPHAQSTPIPPTRFVPSVGATPSRPGVVMLGGQEVDSSSRSTFLQDFWHFDGTQWSQLASTTPIGPRSQGQMAFDPALGLILVGGHSTTPSRTYFNDTWSYDGTLWAPVVGTRFRHPRSQVALAYAADRGRIALFGGRDDTTTYGDTWELTAAGWQEVQPVHRPDPRENPWGAADTRRGRMLIFGGWNRTVTFDETWIYGESDGALATPIGTGCSAGRGPFELTAPAQPWRGELFTLNLQGMPVGPQFTPYLLLGLGVSLGIDLGPLGAPGCELLVRPIPDPAIVIGSNVGGAARFAFVIPPLSSQTTLTWQGMVAAPNANRLGLVFSNGIEVRVR